MAFTERPPLSRLRRRFALPRGTQRRFAPLRGSACGAVIYARCARNLLLILYKLGSPCPAFHL